MQSENKKLNDLKIFTEFMKYVYIYVYIYREREKVTASSYRFCMERGVSSGKNKYRFISPGKGLCW